MLNMINPTTRRRIASPTSDCRGSSPSCSGVERRKYCSLPSGRGQQEETNFRQTVTKREIKSYARSHTDV